MSEKPREVNHFDQSRLPVLKAARPLWSDETGLFPLTKLSCRAADTRGEMPRPREDAARILLLRWLNVVLPLGLGSLIYLGWRTSNLKMFAWVDSLGFAGPVSALREVLSGFLPSLPGWVLYSLPDAVWVYSFTAANWLIWGASDSRERWFWLALGVLLGGGLELGQWASLLPGTFDPTDLFLIFLATLLALLTSWRLS